jgi:hypothetical protein
MLLFKNSSPLLLANIIKAEIKQKEAKEVAIMPVLPNGGDGGGGANSIYRKKSGSSSIILVTQRREICRLQKERKYLNTFSYCICEGRGD